MLQYTQLKFKFDPLMKPEILGSIPMESPICGPSPDPLTGVTRYFKKWVMLAHGSGEGPQIGDSTGDRIQNL